MTHTHPAVGHMRDNKLISYDFIKKHSGSRFFTSGTVELKVRHVDRRNGQVLPDPMNVTMISRYTFLVSEIAT